jgi:hypothetical protein
MSDIFQVGHLERVPLGTPYPGIVAHVGRLLGKLPDPELVIDYTGVGQPVFDLFTYAGISPTGVVITGGAVETGYGAICSVPKLTLVSRLQALLHQGQLKIQKDLYEAETLVRELQDFRVDFTAAGHMTFNARAGKHDDLVLALAIAIWRAYGGGMSAWGDFENTRLRSAAIGFQRAIGPRYFVGVDLGQSRDPTAIAVVRRVDNPTPAELVSMPVATKVPTIYQPGSLEASRTSSPTPVTDEAELRRLEILNRPAHRVVVYEPFNGPGVQPQPAPGSLEYAAAQARKASG